MKFLLDTSTCIAHLRGGTPELSRRFRVHRTELAVCSVVVTELRYGVLRCANPIREQERLRVFLSGMPSIPFDDAAAEAAATVRAQLAGAGMPIGPYDLLIAGIALARQVAVVTCNLREFARVDGLVAVDWTRIAG